MVPLAKENVSSIDSKCMSILEMEWRRQVMKGCLMTAAGKLSKNNKVTLISKAMIILRIWHPLTDSNSTKTGIAWLANLDSIIDQMRLNMGLIRIQISQLRRTEIASMQRLEDLLCLNRVITMQKQEVLDLVATLMRADVGISFLDRPEDKMHQ